MKGLVLTLILTVFLLSVNAQENTQKSRKQCKKEKQAEQIKKVSELVKNKTFVFNAHRAVPLCGDAVSIEYLYFVKVNNNTVNSYLPFYGFESELSIENTPLNFTKSFENYYTNKEDDKYVINFNVPVENDNLKFYFRISELGYAYLKITSTQKQPISFLGIIEEDESLVSSRF